MIDQRFIRNIAEGHVLKLHMPGAEKGNGILRIRHLVGFIKEIKNTGRTRQSILKLGDNAGNFVERLGVLAGIAEKNAQLADGDSAGDGR